MNRLIDANAIITALLYDEEHEETQEVKMSIADFLDSHTVEGCPQNGGWISVNDRLPPNADHPGAFCPRYQVMTKYGVTEGWYNPDKGCWYTLVWFLIGRYTEDDIDMERGDIPKISSKIEVTHWMPLPELPKEDEDAAKG